jgi:cell division septum initiation protein DivIVA
MLERMETGEHLNREEQEDLKERVEATLYKLRELRQRVAELKRKCEEFREMEVQRFENSTSTLKCDRCKRKLNPEEAVIIKDVNGEERSHYHRGCFQQLFK